jgi:hypothetical protein
MKSFAGLLERGISWNTAALLFLRDPCVYVYGPQKALYLGSYSMVGLIRELLYQLQLVLKKYRKNSCENNCTVFIKFAKDLCFFRQ